MNGGPDSIVEIRTRPRSLSSSVKHYGGSVGNGPKLTKCVTIPRLNRIDPLVRYDHRLPPFFESVYIAVDHFDLVVDVKRLARWSCRRFVRASGGRGTATVATGKKLLSGAFTL